MLCKKVMNGFGISHPARKGADKNTNVFCLDKVHKIYITQQVTE